MNRREFSQVFAMLFGYLCGFTVEAEDTDNRGFHLDRIRIEDGQGFIEKCLSDEWQQENKRYGGLLDTLMFQASREEGPGFDCRISPRERKIAGMVIQWLGTNCGRSFLHQASLRMGGNDYPFPTALRAANEREKRGARP